MKRDSTMSMLGVPRSQRVHLEENYDGGILAFLNDCLEAVFARLPISDNYFWRVYWYWLLHERVLPRVP